MNDILKAAQWVNDNKGLLEGVGQEALTALFAMATAPEEERTKELQVRIANLTWKERMEYWKVCITKAQEISSPSVKAIQLIKAIEKLGAVALKYLPLILTLVV